MTDVGHRARTSLSSLGGTALAATIRAVSAARQAAKPLHPRGDVVLGRLERTGVQPATGVAWLDEPGEDEVLVRGSRAVGLPGPVPDVHGLAVRVPFGGARHGDLLFASTGLGRVSRFVLTASRAPYGRPMTTLLPYRTPHGPLLLAVTAASDTELELSCASPTGGWRTFGYLTLSGTAGPDLMISFDPLLNTVPGLDNYDWVRRLREPSYLTARRSR
jgi:hypothetical protein